MDIALSDGFRIRTWLKRIPSVKRPPRPGRRATSLLVGLACLLIMLDGVAHPHGIDGLWTFSAARHLVGLMALRD
jgi:hypothetical protein